MGEACADDWPSRSQGGLSYASHQNKPTLAGEGDKNGFPSRAPALGSHRSIARIPLRRR